MLIGSWIWKLKTDEKLLLGIEKVEKLWTKFGFAYSNNYLQIFTLPAKKASLDHDYT